MVTIICQTASDIKLSNRKQANKNVTTLSIREKKWWHINDAGFNFNAGSMMNINQGDYGTRRSIYEEYQSGCCREGSRRRRRLPSSKASIKNMNQDAAEKVAEGEDDFLRRRQHVVASGDHRAKPK